MKESECHKGPEPLSKFHHKGQKESLRDAQFEAPPAETAHDTNPTAKTRLSERGGLRRPGVCEGEEHEACHDINGRTLAMRYAH